MSQCRKWVVKDGNKKGNDIPNICDNNKTNNGGTEIEQATMKENDTVKEDYTEKYVSEDSEFQNNDNNNNFINRNDKIEQRTMEPT